MIRVNGREVGSATGRASPTLLADLGVEPDARGVAVAVDGEVVPRGDVGDAHRRPRARGWRP